MPTKEELRNRRETQITRAAYEIIAKNGYENITVQDIADHAGFSKGIVYYYFIADSQIWFMTLYDKDEVEDLSPDEQRLLKAAIEHESRQRARRRGTRRA